VPPWSPQTARSLAGLVVTRHHRPVAVVVGMQRLVEIDEMTADLRDLAQRLIHTAGVSPEKVAALDLEQAVDLWTGFTSSPRGSDGD
jgi:hypothetical protein